MKNIYITMPGDRRENITNRRVSWTDRNGVSHIGKVIDYGRTTDGSGSPVTYQKFVYTIDCGSYGKLELRPHELRPHELRPHELRDILNGRAAM